ncbi:GNAT family N-acetyltransferase [Bacillus sp. REN16]|uniref:GNAT family N-acetyltransferase n=1 Tax=Bacillus sp. REN16 TaxID=2887296 RepID=UPI001E314355|nr:GNAT family N-acetyltransferase [Bacillus sp. REN16]MCC3356075.1 GNAT family N-acetyltransferase [Bacillus sp. REN16]
MKIRKAILSDAKGIAKVHVDSWRTTYKGIIPDEFLQRLSYESREKMWERGIPNGHILVAENNSGEIAGFACGGKERSGSYENYQGELYAIYILQEYQGQGLGKKLVIPVVKQLLDKDFNTMLVLVLEENKSCLFYEALGARKLNTFEVEIGGKNLKEAVYGWDNLKANFNTTF